MEYFYAFVIPVWALIQLATLRSTTGNLACDMTTPEQDRLQCYWAKYCSLPFRTNLCL